MYNDSEEKCLCDNHENDKKNELPQTKFASDLVHCLIYDTTFFYLWNLQNKIKKNYIFYHILKILSLILSPCLYNLLLFNYIMACCFCSCCFKWCVCVAVNSNGKTKNVLLMMILIIHSELKCHAIQFIIRQFPCWMFNSKFNSKKTRLHYKLEIVFMFYSVKGFYVVIFVYKYSLSE